MTAQLPPRDGSGRRSALYRGRLRHRRFRPVEHRFAYPVYHAALDLDELAALDREVVGFAHNRAGPAAFHDRDHLGTADAPVRDKLAAWVRAQGRAMPAGPVLLVTNLRTLGHVFNPVSWFFCYDDGGRLALVVAEVCNTFGETHGYLLDDLARAGPTVRARTAKRFHVSPFMDIAGHAYDFALRPPGERLAVHMDVSDGDGRLFDATLSSERRPLTTRTLWRTLLRYPLMGLQTLAAIHWQALRLWARRVPVRAKPPPPPSGFSGADAGPPAGAVAPNRPPAPDRPSRRQEAP